MRILLAEDDPRLGPLIVHMLKKECHTTDWVKNGEDALDYAVQTSYDLLILDWMMPLKDGVAVCKELRAQGYIGGILMLTAKDALQNRVEGLDAGADDYLVKPFEFAELFARIRSLSRRVQQPINEIQMTIGSFKLNLIDHTLLCGEEVVTLTIREFQLLELLMRNYGRVITREVILERIWGYEVEITSNTLDALVKLLRKKLEYCDHPLVIHNIRGVGYKLEAIEH